ncbi:TPR-like protein [Cristinia sonorae]|uniref:TPR-like protein n=1 Tax=Cristinia sonorae TaxID=1940300 RepID=A0A8K0XSE5_9AGAR|nr:TPR-like protein [Cristinia sonorae]
MRTIQNDPRNGESSDDGTSNASSEEDEEEGSNEEEGEDIPANLTKDMEDGDFDRLVRGIRESENGSSSGMLGKAWNINVEAQEAEFRDDLREASGVGKRKGKRGKRGGVVLSPEVRALVGGGNQAYVDNDIEKTMKIMQEVIRVEPRAESAWRVLAQCHEDSGNSERALLMRVMAAHLSNDPDEWDALAERSRSLGFHQQALYCYRKLYNLDPSNTTALWDRAALAKEIGELRTAYHSLLAILRKLPHDLTVLEELRPILIELSELDLCAKLFQGAFDHYFQTFPTGIGINPDTQTEVPGGGFGLMEVLVLADLYNTLAHYDKAVETIRKGCRWLQGRAKQVFWDNCEDDREYDAAEGIRTGEGDIQPGMYALDVNARHRLAIARLKSGDITEGKMHAKIVLAEDVKEYAPLFGEIADAYFDGGLYAEAGQIYEILGADSETSSIHTLMQAAACRHMVGDIKEAAEVYEHIIAADVTNKDAKMKLAEMYESLGEVRKALDLVLQVIDSRKRSRGGKQDAEGQDTDPARSSLFEEKARAGKIKQPRQHKMSAAELRKAEASVEKEVTQWYHRVTELWPVMLAGQEDAMREWILEAEKLIEMFRHTRPLFLSTRHQGFRGMFPRSAKRKTTEASEESMAVRLQLELRRCLPSVLAIVAGRFLPGRDSTTQTQPNAKGRFVDSFRTISFDNWLRLFIQYAFLMTQRDEVDYAVEVLRHVSWSNAFQDPKEQDTIRFAIIACAINGNRLPIAVEQARKLINTHQFNNEPFRILLASLGHGMHATDAILASTLSKHLLRELKTIDSAIKNKDTLKWNNVTKRYAPTGAKAEEEDEEETGGTAAVSQHDDGKDASRPNMPTKHNPMCVALYGQICLAAKSYQSALFYLLHAYEYCPHDPMICLCLAVASIGRAMQRQADNRHHLITQGLAFLTKYRRLRGDDAQCMDEVEYNFGRAFHQIGLLTHAARHYERVLEIAEKHGGPDVVDSGISSTAAYNLSLIYTTTGSVSQVEALYRRWLSL